jgi:chromosome segregation ATPase
MAENTEWELRHNLEQAQTGLVQEFQDHQETKRRAASLEKKLIDAVNERETLKEQLRQAHVVIQMLNERLALKS